MAQFYGLYQGNCDLKYVRWIAVLRKINFRGLKVQLGVGKADFSY